MSSTARNMRGLAQRLSVLVDPGAGPGDGDLPAIARDALLFAADEMERMQDELARRERIEEFLAPTKMKLPFGLRLSALEALVIVKALEARSDLRPEEVIARTAEGQRLTASDVARLLRASDPRALGFLEDLFGAALRIVALSHRRAQTSEARKLGDSPRRLDNRCPCCAAVGERSGDGFVCHSPTCPVQTWEPKS